MKKVFLFLLGLVATIGIQAQTSPWAGNEVKAGEFYLYNVESGLWLQNNDSKANDWSTRAAIGTRGLDFNLVESEGAYTLGSGFGSASINPDNNYLDTGNNPAWTFTPATVEGITNAYNIKCGNKVLGVVRYNEAGKQDNLFTQIGDERWYLENPDFNIDMATNNTWQLVTKAERLAKMTADASVDNPQDASWLIPSADFANNDRRWDNLWTRSLNGGNGRAADGNGIAGSKCVESWNSGTIDLSISISVPNGTYKLAVQGYYRDGNVNDVVARRDAGTETIRSYYFANEVSHPLMSILDEAKDAKVDGAWDTERSGRWYPDSQNSANKCFNLHKGYVNPEIEVVVTTGILKIGITKSEGVANDWTVVDNFKLTYLGNNIDISTYIEGLQNTINDAKAFDVSNTTTALATALSDAITAGEGKLESTDVDEISAATGAIAAALDKAKAVNVNILKATIALAKREGVDVTAAEDLITTATENAPLTAMLEALRTARKIKALGGAPDIYKGAEPTADTEYYFYNLGTGMWLSAGSDWNTHAAVDQAGWLFKLNESGDGFTITSSMGSFNNSPYVDTGVNTVYKFQAVSVEGEEKIYNILEGTDLLGYNPDGKTDGKKYWSSVSNVAGADAADLNYQWKLVTKAERDALVAAATKTAPVDATYLINNPSLLRKPGYDMWSKEANGGNGGARVSSQDDGNGDRAADYGFEFWNSDSFKFSQKLEGLPAGIYELSVQGFWREGDGAYQSNIVNEGGALKQLAYVFANGEKALLPNIASCLDFVPGVGTAATNNGAFPNWPREAFEYFETGAYTASVKAIVGEDGELTIGVGVDEKAVGGDWVVFDNFRLKYLGNDEAEVAYMRALKAIEDKGTYRIFTEVEEGKKLYLNASGKLVDSAKKAATFTFNAVNANGTLYATGWNLGSKFTNPSLTNGSTGDVVQKGGINVGSNDRPDWERQVLFLNAEGKFAIRATNANSANWGANTYWDCVEYEELPAAGYSLNPSYVWQIEANVDNRPTAWAKTNAWGVKLYDIVGGGVLTEASQFSSNAKESSEGSYEALVDGNYSTFFHSTWSSKADADHYLQVELPEAMQDFFVYFKKRQQNNNNRPTNMVISGSNDGENFTEITAITEGMPTGAEPIDYLSDKISATEAYKYLRFTVIDTNNHAAEGNGHKFFTFSEFNILPVNALLAEAAPLMYGDYTDMEDDDVAKIEALDAKIETQAEYAAAMAAIEDGAAYRIFTNVGETPYYLTADGKLTDDKTASGSFVFAKVEGEEFPYGFNLKDSYFTNPPQGGNPKLDNGQIATDPTSKRATWEAQVFFLKDGKYAVRATNAAGAESGWGLNATAFWTVNNGEGGPVAEYSFDKNFLWELEDMSTIKVTYVMFDAEDTQIGEPVVAVQEIGSEVKVPAEFLGAGYYAYTADKEGAVTEECTIKITRTYKTGLVMDLASLNNAKAYTITCDRGALLTKDDFLASTGHKSLTDAEPANFAIISYNENYYLYSVADQKFVTNTGALAAMPTNGEKDAIKMEAKDGWNAPYFMYYFTVAEGTNYGLNTNGNDPYGYVINSWMNADGGNMYYMIEAADFDATEAIAALDAYFNPSCVVTYIVKDAAGKELFTSEPEPAMMGSTITTLPAAHQRPFTTYNEVDVTIEAAETTIVFTATSEFPFELSSDFATAKWYNMTIRGEWWVGTEGKNNDEGIPVPEPYYPVQQTEDDAALLKMPAYQWAFTGDAYNGIIVWNKGAGEGFTLTSADDMAVMREGEYLWTIGQNSDGFTLRETGTEFNCINQNGGAGGPLTFWKSSGSLGDNGSTFRITPAPAADPVEFTIKENKSKTGIGSGTQDALTKVKINTPFKLQAAAKNMAANNLSADELTIHFDMVVGAAFKSTAWNMTEMTRIVLQDVNVPFEQYFTVPLEFSEEYPIIQSINFVGAKLMKGDEVIAEFVTEEPFAVRFIELVDENGNSFVKDGIKSIFDENAENVFDLSGRKVQKVQKGRAYIIDGKKAVIRKK